MVKEELKNIHVTLLKHGYVQIGQNGYSNEPAKMDLYTLFSYYLAGYGKEISKAHKEAILPHTLGFRQSKENINDTTDWEGYVPIDIDIKNKEIAKEIFNKNIQWPSFVAALNISTGGSGLHIHCVVKPNDTFYNTARTLSENLSKLFAIYGYKDQVYYTIKDGKKEQHDWFDSHNWKIYQVLYRSSNSFKLNDDWILTNVKTKKYNEISSDVENDFIITDTGSSFEAKSNKLEPDDNARRCIAIVFYSIFGADTEKFKELVVSNIKNTDNRKKNTLTWFESVCKNPVKWKCNEYQINICKKYFDIDVKYKVVENEQVEEKTNNSNIIINKYLSESDVLENYDWSGKTFLVAPTGTGKTTLFERLIEKNDFDKVIILEPKQSIVLNKCKNHPEFGQWIATDVRTTENKDGKIIYAVYDSFANITQTWDDKDFDRILVVFDESHNINELIDYRSKAFKCFTTITTKCKNSVIMTGTETFERGVYKPDKIIYVTAKEYKNRNIDIVLTANMSDDDLVEDIIKRYNEYEPDNVIIYCDSTNTLVYLQQMLPFEIKISNRHKPDERLNTFIQKDDNFGTTSYLKEGVDIKTDGYNSKVLAICIDNKNNAIYPSTLPQISERIRNPKEIKVVYYNRYDIVSRSVNVGEINKKISKGDVDNDDVSIYSDIITRSDIWLQHFRYCDTEFETDYN